MRVFSYDTNTEGLMLGECKNNSSNDSRCKDRYYDFGDYTNDKNKWIVIVAYGSHFELVTNYIEGEFKYNIYNIYDSINNINHEKTDVKPKYYNTKGILVNWEDLLIDDKIIIKKQEIIRHLLNMGYSNNDINKFNIYWEKKKKMN